MEAVNVMNVPDFADAITGYFNRREAMTIADEGVS
jgi:replicative DNA helicase